MQRKLKIIVYLLFSTVFFSLIVLAVIHFVFPTLEEQVTKEITIIVFIISTVVAFFANVNGALELFSGFITKQDKSSAQTLEKIEILKALREIDGYVKREFIVGQLARNYHHTADKRDQIIDELITDRYVDEKSDMLKISDKGKKYIKKYMS